MTVTTYNQQSLQARQLSKRYGTKDSTVYALSRMDVTIKEGETLAVVGESGCGKSTLAKILIGLETSDSGQISFAGESIFDRERGTQYDRKNEIAMVFQDPYSSLNPKMKIRSIIAEAIPRARYKALKKSGELNEKILSYLTRVGLGEPHLERYPHEFSGGQRQRIAIGRALAQEPSLLILDEPTAALDVSVQAQILRLLKTLQRDMNLSMLFISHDLATVAYMADQVMVMYLGLLMERGDCRDVLQRPKHPYTQALINSIPKLDPAKRGEFAALKHELTARAGDPNGCAFANRCPYAQAKCQQETPALTHLESGRTYACFYPLQEQSS